MLKNTCGCQSTAVVNQIDWCVTPLVGHSKICITIQEMRVSNTKLTRKKQRKKETRKVFPHSSPVIVI